MAARKRKTGRPKMGHSKITCYLMPTTVTTIKSLKNSEVNTFGKVIDHHFKKTQKP